MSSGPYIIQFRTSGSGSFAALDGSGLLPIYGDLKMPFSGIAQIEQLFNSEYPLTRACGNRTYQTSFWSKTQHDTEADAMEYPITQAAALPDFIDLKVLFGSGTVALLTGAVLTRFDPEETGGIANTIHYQFSGGVLTTS